MKPNQRTLFDAAASEALKVRGMARAEEKDPTLIEYARAIAKRIARTRGEVTADDVQKELVARHGITLGNAAGSLFKGKDWYFTGRWAKSERVSSHSRAIRIWRLRSVQ